MVSLAIVCQFLHMVVVIDLPMSEKGVIMRMFVFVCRVPRDNNKLLNVSIRPFLCS